MSLDVYLETDRTLLQEACIPIRIDGQLKKVTREEYAEMYPGREPYEVPMALTNDVYWANITHNLGKMARVADLYMPLWRPDECGITTAAQLIEPLRDGLSWLRADPDHYRQFNPANGWGTYEGLVQFVEDYLQACEMYPDARVIVSR